LRPDEACNRNSDDLTVNQIGREGWEPIVLAVCPAILNGDVLTLNEAKFA
jgi:hypothetical protein